MISAEVSYPNVKRVNIYPYRPVTTVTPAIRNVTRNAVYDLETIRRCIAAKAVVEEILPDNTRITLTFGNFNKDNRPKAVNTDIKKADKIIENAKTVDNKSATPAPKVEPEKKIVPENKKPEVINTTDASKSEPKKEQTNTVKTADNKPATSTDVKTKDIEA